MSIFNNCLYIFLGFFTNYINYLGVKLTAKEFLRTKNQSIIAMSLVVRLLAFAFVFYVLTRGSFRKAILFVLGVSLSTILFMIIKIANGKKNENIAKIADKNIDIAENINEKIINEKKSTDVIEVINEKIINKSKNVDIAENVDEKITNGSENINITENIDKKITNEGKNIDTVEVINGGKNENING